MKGIKPEKTNRIKRKRGAVGSSGSAAALWAGGRSGPVAGWASAGGAGLEAGAQAH